jgi:lactoylglutathione lyase
MGSAFPILSVDDLAATAAFYRRLGFVEIYRFPEEGDPAFVTLERDGDALGLGAGAAATDRFSYWVDVEDVDAALADLRAAGVTVVSEPADRAWEERVAEVRDPAGNLVRLAQPSGQPEAAP